MPSQKVTLVHRTGTQEWMVIRERIFNAVGTRIEDTRRAQVGLRIAIGVTLVAFALFLYISALLAL